VNRELQEEILSARKVMPASSSSMLNRIKEPYAAVCRESPTSFTQK